MDPSFFQELDIPFLPEAPLSEYTTFRLGGPCRYLIHCQTPEQLIATVRYLEKQQKDFMLIGGGSNLVVSDEGVDTVIVRYASDAPRIERDGNDLVAAAATDLDDLARFAVEEGLEGLNCTTGIPGTVGGAIVGNAGAFGSQVGDYLVSVTLLKKDGNVYDSPPGDLGFSYRYSNLRERDEIVVAARFRLTPGNPDELQKERDHILALRASKHPDLKAYPCAGSFFRNIEPTSQAERRQAAGWFLEEAGAKELSSGGASVFEKHANIIVKGKNCRAQDVFELSRLMASAAKKKFDLDLVREVRFVGKFQGMPDDVRGWVW